MNSSSAGWALFFVGSIIGLWADSVFVMLWALVAGGLAFAIDCKAPD